MLDKVIRNVQVCIPFRHLIDKHLSMVIKNRINPEIGIDGDLLDTSPTKTLSRIGALLQQEGLSITLHAPFFDLAPGAMDTLILHATRQRLQNFFDLIPLFNPKTIVCHTGYDKKRYSGDRKKWLDISFETWAPLVQQLHGTQTVMVLENVYEKTPDILLKLLNGLDRAKTGFCFDTGHMSAFSSTNMDEWLARLGPYLKQLHLHDNDGAWDRHWAIGSGKIDFEMLFRYAEILSQPLIFTVEAHREDWMWQSFESLSESPPFLRMISSEQRGTS